jgi:CPA2 family monovalent cation:H+ antiporter-2
MADGPLLQVGIVFAVLAVGGALAARLDQSVIPAYIVAGLAVGPNAPAVAGVDLALVESGEVITLLSELGVIFLLFFIGLEFNLERLLASRDRILRAGLLDLGLNFGVGLALGLALGFGALGAVFLAGIVYISSSAVITKTLIDLGWIADPESEAILGTLVFEDVVIAVYLALLSAVAVGGAGVFASLGRSLAFLVALVALAAVGTGPLDRALATRSDELFLLRVVGAAVLLGGIALSLGVSEAVAAFFLGAAVGGTEQAERVEGIITSERDLFAAVFFFSIGLGTDPAVLGGVVVPVAVLAVVTTATKLVSGYYGGRSYGLSARRSVRVGVAMVARGEFSLVIAALAASTAADPALAARTVVPELSTIPAVAVGYVLVMSVLGTVLMRNSGRIERLVAADSQ